MLGNRLADTAMDAATVNDALQRLEAAQSEVNELLNAGRYEEAITQSEAMYRLATSLPKRADATQLSILASIASTHREISAQMAEKVQSFQTTGRKRQKAITAYGKRGVSQR